MAEKKVRWGQAHKAELCAQFESFEKDNDTGISPYLNPTKNPDDKTTLEEIYHSFADDHILRVGITVESLLRNYVCLLYTSDAADE